MKLILRIILDRNSAKINQEISEHQSGFLPNKGTRERIFNLRTILDRSLEVQKPVIICFIDYEKAFDRVFDEEIMKSLKTRH